MSPLSRNKFGGPGEVSPAPPLSEDSRQRGSMQGTDGQMPCTVFGKQSKALVDCFVYVWLFGSMGEVCWFAVALFPDSPTKEGEP